MACAPSTAVEAPDAPVLPRPLQDCPVAPGPASSPLPAHPLPINITTLCSMCSAVPAVGAASAALFTKLTFICTIWVLG